MREYFKNCTCPKCGTGGEWYPPGTILESQFVFKRKCKNCAHTWEEATLDSPELDRNKKKSGFPIPAFMKGAN